MIRRSVTAAQDPTHSYEVAEVLINGVPLQDLWKTAGGDQQLPLTPDESLRRGERIWLGEPAADPEFVADGYTAVLTCDCGVYGCGGVRARIEIGQELVKWSDFEVVNGDGDLELPLGPFRFDRRRYEAAIEAATVG